MTKQKFLYDDLTDRSFWLENGKFMTGQAPIDEITGLPSIEDKTPDLNSAFAVSDWEKEESYFLNSYIEDNIYEHVIQILEKLIQKEEVS